MFTVDVGGSEVVSVVVRGFLATTFWAYCPLCRGLILRSPGGDFWYFRAGAGLMKSAYFILSLNPDSCTLSTTVSPSFVIVNALENNEKLAMTGINIWERLFRSILTKFTWLGGNSWKKIGIFQKPDNCNCPSTPYKCLGPSKVFSQITSLTRGKVLRNVWIFFLLMITAQWGYIMTPDIRDGDTWTCFTNTLC